MRVRFLQDYQDTRSGASEGLILPYAAGEVTHLDTATARSLIASKIADEAPTEFPSVRVRLLRTTEVPHPFNPRERITYRKGELWHLPEDQAVELVHDGAAEEEPDSDHDPVGAELEVKKEQARVAKQAAVAAQAKAASTPAASAAPAASTTTSSAGE